MRQKIADEIIENVEKLKSRIKPYKIYPVKIVKKIDKETYIIELFDCELIAHSIIDFENKNGLVQVISTLPSLHLKFLNPNLAFDNKLGNFIFANKIELNVVNQYILSVFTLSEIKFDRETFNEKIDIAHNLFNVFDYNSLLPLKEILPFLINFEENTSCLDKIAQVYAAKGELELSSYIGTIFKRILYEVDMEMIPIFSNFSPDTYAVFKTKIDDNIFAVVEREKKKDFEKLYTQVHHTIIPKFSIKIIKMERELSIVFYCEQGMFENDLYYLKEQIKKILEYHSYTLIHYAVHIKPFLGIEEKINEIINN